MRLVRKRKLLRARDLAQPGLPTIALTRLVLLAVVSQRTNLAARLRFDGWAR